MGGHYPAGGINLGPAMTFGHVAGVTLAGARAPALDEFDEIIGRTTGE
ncbi:hypothetical protein J4H86_12900 [Spiractinospora alimapuensis]|nr:hypothetical protein [Spiractinospora alimapuensis]QVQ54480.1 hypothetical protein J4H86_12900 [Spiractinospora alimapuensis]